MKLLLKLCYGGSYIYDEEELLDASTRIRLAFLGSAFEMEECVWECLSSLADNLAFSDALTILNDVPKELCDHEAMTVVVAKVVDVITNMLNSSIFSDPRTAVEQEFQRQVANALGEASGCFFL